jgi:hypothetical protein
MPSQIAENVPPDLAARTQIKTTGAETDTAENGA